MGSGKAIAGGLLFGLGEGMAARAEAKRQAALEQAKEIRRMLEKEDDRSFQRDLKEEDREARRGLLSSVKADENRNLIGVTAGGDVKELGVRMPPEKNGRADSSGMSAGDQRLWSVVKDKYTKKGMQGETTDWAAMAKELSEQHSRPDLAKLAQPAGGDSGIDLESPEWREAKAAADEWVDEQAGVFSRDKSDFADFGGNPEQARQAKAQEFYRQFTGKGGRSEKPSKGKSPPGSGSQGDPYRATAQEQIDWFKKNAPAGSVIEVNGKLYQK